jgi:hypothetical protein
LGETEVQLEKTVDLQGGPKRLDGVSFFLAIVPEVVGCVGRDGYGLSRLNRSLLAPDAEAQRAGDDFGTALLKGVDMLQLEGRTGWVVGVYP